MMRSRNRNQRELELTEVDDYITMESGMQESGEEENLEGRGVI